MKPVGKNPWWVVVAAILGLIVSNGPIIQFSFGPFLLPLGEEFGADRATLSTAILLAFTATAIFTPFAGRLVDRHGIRAFVLPAIVLFALATAALALSPSSIYMFIGLYTVLGVFAAGQTPVAYAKAVAGHFVTKRGLAIGVSMAGVGLGAAIIPQIAQAMISAFDWRTAYVGLGIFVFLCAFPAALLLLREPPLAAPQKDGRKGGQGVSVGEALRAREFWCLLIIFLTMVVASAGAVAHLVPILRDSGLSARTATSAISVAGLALIVGRLIAGYLLDKVFAAYVTLVFLAITLCGVGLLFMANSPQAALLAAICIGLGLGAEIDLMAYFVSRYFGMRSFGEIYGYLFAVFNFGCGLGPFLMGLSHSRTGSYDTTLIAFVVALVLAATLVFALRPYRFER